MLQSTSKCVAPANANASACFRGAMAALNPSGGEITTPLEGGGSKMYCTFKFVTVYGVLQNGQKLCTKIPEVRRKANDQVEIKFNASKLYCTNLRFVV